MWSSIIDGWKEVNIDDKITNIIERKDVFSGKNSHGRKGIRKIFR